MEFSEIFDRLEPGKYFDTVWVALPSETQDILRKLLIPIKKYCEWVSGVEVTNEAHTIPHISLRYLGYDSKELRERIKKDIPLFQSAIKGVTPVSIVVKGISIWEGKDKGGNPSYRLNWNIVNGKSLKDIHQRLLEVKGYAFYSGLEDENFKPHISLARIMPEHIDKIREHVSKLPLQEFIFNLVDFGLNLASPNIEENLRIPLVIHKPKNIESSQGLGLPNTTKVVKTLSPTTILIEETWNEMEKPWSQGGIVIANPGYKWISKWEECKNYVIEKMLDDKGELVGIYCDICSPVKKTDNGYQFEDWYLDVWQPANQKPQLLDEDELESAVTVGYLTEEQADIARKTTNQLMEELERNVFDF